MKTREYKLQGDLIYRNKYYFPVYNSGPCTLSALWIVVWHLFLHLLAELTKADTNFTKVFNGVVGSFYICRATDVFTKVCNWLLFVLAETSATDI